ncbi:hypothetical protein Bca52824_003073 [Brassica carinata]|uniref:Transcription factor CBF/NF-Y/archaeal histone domain-containing protein n=1 Tax=Brassica carinata TaxID=52824 RepID=A0A8X7WJ30_BRACI|nr:hypothetical protein Bca52824_003073 [Brassica carinata]
MTESEKVLVDELPLAIVRRVVKDKLSECSPEYDVSIHKEAVLAFSESARIFIHYLSATANDNCKDSRRQTMKAEDVFKAIEDMGFDEFSEPLKASLEEIADGCNYIVLSQPEILRRRTLGKRQVVVVERHRRSHRDEKEETGRSISIKGVRKSKSDEVDKKNDENDNTEENVNDEDDGTEENGNGEEHEKEEEDEEGNEENMEEEAGSGSGEHDEKESGEEEEAGE